MKLLLYVSSVLSWIFGGVQLLAPGQFYAQAGITMTPMFAPVARTHGATLVGLGVVNWLARGAEDGGSPPSSAETSSC